MHPGLETDALSMHYTPHLIIIIILKSDDSHGRHYIKMYVKKGKTYCYQVLLYQ